MRQAFWRGCMTGLAVAAVTLLPIAGVSWLVDRVNRGER